MQDSFLPDICLDLYAFFFEFLSVSMSVYEIENPSISIVI